MEASIWEAMEGAFRRASKKTLREPAWSDLRWLTLSDEKRRRKRHYGRDTTQHAESVTKCPESPYWSVWWLTEGLRISDSSVVLMIQIDLIPL